MTVSAVIPCYNAEPFIADTIRSVLAQTHPPDEVIVVDDGSKDRSFEVAASFGGPVRAIRQENAGECAARNRGMDEAQGSWIAFLDADDVWEPTKLERQFERLEGELDVVLVHTGTYNFGDGVPGGRQVMDVHPFVLEGRYDTETLLLEPLVTPSTAMVPGGLSLRFPVGVAQGGDMLFFTELRRQGRFLCVPEPLTGYRVHANQVTRRGDAWVRHFQNRLAWLEQQQAVLGPQQTDHLRGLLRQQILTWIDVARWNRQWERYDSLKAWALTLAWDAGVPPVLTERTWPRAVYSVKDAADRLLGREGGPR